MSVIEGNDNDNEVIGANNADTTKGFGGNDTFRGRQGNDDLFGGDLSMPSAAVKATIT